VTHPSPLAFFREVGKARALGTGKLGTGKKYRL
jgi:hypothetical protein